MTAPRRRIVRAALVVGAAATLAVPVAGTANATSAAPAVTAARTATAAYPTSSFDVLVTKLISKLLP